jgi:hypothetical protein
MALWELDAFKPPIFLGFVRAAYDLVPTQYQGSTWLPNQTVDDLTFEYLLGANRRQAMATVLSYDSEAPLMSRQGYGERILGELPPIKRKARIGEKEIIRFQNPRFGTNDVGTAIDQVYNDTLDLVASVQSRIEWMAAQVMSEDLLVYDEDGIKWAFDYGVNGDFQWNIPPKTDHHSRWGGGATDQTIPVGGPWNNPTTATYINDLQQICTRVQNVTGQRPTDLWLSLTARNNLVNSTEIKNLVRGTVSGTTTIMLTPGEVQSVFDLYDLPTLHVYDTVVTKENKDGSLTDVRTMAVNKAILTQGRPVGAFLHGPTAESRIGLGYGQIGGGQNLNTLTTSASAPAAPGIWANTYSTDEPPAQWTKVAAVAFPTAPEMNRVAQLTLW